DHTNLPGSVAGTPRPPGASSGSAGVTFVSSSAQRGTAPGQLSTRDLRRPSTTATPSGSGAASPVPVPSERGEASDKALSVSFREKGVHGAYPEKIGWPWCGEQILRRDMIGAEISGASAIDALRDGLR